MAKLLSPVSTTDSLLKFQTSSSSSFCSNNQWRILAKTSISSSNLCPTTSGSGKRGGRIKAVTEESSSFDGVADDYYAVLGLLPDATPEQIKKAYYSCMKSCHPDFNENDPEINNFCMFINEIYEVLSDPVQRMVYDDIHGYSLTATNPFLDDSSTKDHAFVDEFSCIVISALLLLLLVVDRVNAVSESKLSLKNRRVLMMIEHISLGTSTNEKERKNSNKTEQKFSKLKDQKLKTYPNHYDESNVSVFLDLCFAWRGFEGRGFGEGFGLLH
ncbi:hypothetical protein ACHQM5_018365 [Ranunculus cassubicifolius]